MASPLLWTTLDIALPAPAERLEYRLAQALVYSRSADLTVRIRYRHGTATSLRVVQMIAQESDRVQDLTVIGDMDPFSVWDNHDMAFPNLTNFTYSFMGALSAPDIEGQFRWLRKRPLLSGSASDEERTIIPIVHLMNGSLFPNLIQCLGYNTQISTLNIYCSYISQSREIILPQYRLSKLHIDVTVGDAEPDAPAPTAVDLPDLISLSIRVGQSHGDDDWDWKDPLAEIFDQFDTSRLAELDIDHGATAEFPHPWPFQSFERFVSRLNLGGTLQTFKLNNTDGLTQDSFLSILRLLPALKRLVISGIGTPRSEDNGVFSPSPIMPSFFDHLIYPSFSLGGQVWILPNLTHFDLTLNRPDLLPGRLAKAMDFADSRMNHASIGPKLDELTLHLFGDFEDPVTIQSLERLYEFRRRGWNVYYFRLSPPLIHPARLDA